MTTDNPNNEDAEARSEPSIGVRELRAALATHLDRVEAGASFIVERGGRPVARLGPIQVNPVGGGLVEMARLGLIKQPRSASGVSTSEIREPASAAALPVDVRVDRVIRQVRG